jgi:hypothetical protein
VAIQKKCSIFTLVKIYSEWVVKLPAWFVHYAKKNLPTYCFLVMLRVVQDFPEYKFRSQRQPRQFFFTRIKNFIYSPACIADSESADGIFTILHYR